MSKRAAEPRGSGPRGQGHSQHGRQGRHGALLYRRLHTQLCADFPAQTVDFPALPTKLFGRYPDKAYSARCSGKLAILSHAARYSGLTRYTMGCAPPVRASQTHAHASILAGRQAGRQTDRRTHTHRLPGQAHLCELRPSCHAHSLSSAHRAGGLSTGCQLESRPRVVRRAGTRVTRCAAAATAPRGLRPCSGRCQAVAAGA